MQDLLSFMLYMGGLFPLMSLEPVDITNRKSPVGKPYNAFFLCSELYFFMGKLNQTKNSKIESSRTK